MTRWAVLLLPVLGLLAYDPGGGPDDHALKYLVLMAAAFVAVACSLEARRLAWSRASLALWVFVAVRGVMLLRSPMTPRSLRWWSLLLALALVHHAACAAAPRRWLARFAPPVLAGTAAIVSVVAIAQWLLGAPQAHATFANRSFAGAGLAMLLPFALAARGRIAVVPLCLLGLAAMQSRGGLLAAAVAAALFVGWRVRAARWPLVVGVPAAVLVAGLVFGQSATVEARVVWYRTAFAMGCDHPALGLGADGFAREYPPVRPREEWELHQGRVVHSVHDDYLESFAEGGLLGLGAHLFLLGAAAWALRRRRAALASLAAFATASLVDLPLRDPSLLALALFPLAFAPRRAVRFPFVLPATLAALLATGYFLPLHLAHWRADRAFGRFLADGDRAALAAALRLERRHPEALLARSNADDLALLLRMEPHNASAHLNRTRFLSDEEAVAALEEILALHDPHHRLTRQRLAELRERAVERRAREVEPLIATEPLRAASLLEGIVREHPRTYVPYLLLARLYRQTGPPETVDRYLREAEARASNAEVAEERLAFEGEELAAGRVHVAGIRRAAAMLPSTALRERIGARLAAARAAEERLPAPDLPAEEGEDPAAYAARLMKARADRRAELQRRTRADYVLARVLSEGLLAREPRADHVRLVARAVRGEGDLERAAQLEATALFLETLEALAEGDELLARRRYDRARRAYPGLPQEPTVREALRLFAAGDAERLRHARALFGDDPDLRAALGD